ncbi:hypothetical protein AB0I66_32210 [Streptomyces sp. NPDC050439]|uniref:hypothetical protein n=1 Tax=unclassified Streptomyces TaxID=2593676 RepID=UPI00344AEF29
MSTGPRIALDESAEDPGAAIWFAEPAGFTAIPMAPLLNLPTAPGADGLRVALGPLLEAAPDDVSRERFVAELAAGQEVLRVLCEAGTVHCSVGLHRDDVAESGGDAEGRPLRSFFTLSWRDTAVAPPSVTAARSVTPAGHHTRIEYVDLPSGPASISETVRTPSPDSGLAQQPLLQIHAHIPHPEGKRLAVLTLTTTEIAHREQYRAILDQMAGLVSFDDPLASREQRAESREQRAESRYCRGIPVSR